MRSILCERLSKSKKWIGRKNLNQWYYSRIENDLDIWLINDYRVYILDNMKDKGTKH